MIFLAIEIWDAWDGGIKALSAPRSPKWKAVRERHLKERPCCEACGCRKGVVPHHVIPVHFDPSLELDPSNLISLCESRTFNCHLFFGHLKRWDRHNPHVIEDAKHWRDRISDSGPPLPPQSHT